MIGGYFDNLVEFEGCTTWLYCDSRGFATVGIGNLVASPSACAGHPWQHEVVYPSDLLPGEAETLWARTTDAYRPGKGAAYYRDQSDLRLTLDYVRGLVATRLEDEFIPGIARLCHDFDAWPLPARKAVVDMAYNLGLGGLAQFHNLIAACQARDWLSAADECHRSTCRDTRNEWTRHCFASAAAMV